MILVLTIWLSVITIWLFILTAFAVLRSSYIEGLAKDAKKQGDRTANLLDEHKILKRLDSLEGNDDNKRTTSFADQPLLQD